MIKKAYVDHHLSDKDIGVEKVRGIKTDLQRIKEELTQAFYQIEKAGQNHWSNMVELTDDYVEALKVISNAQMALKEKDPFELELE